MTPATSPPVVCYDCGSAFSFPERTRCDCGEPLWFDVELEPGDFGAAVYAAVRQEGSDVGPTAADPPASATSIWRYATGLPGVAPVGLASGTGGTPLYRLAALDDYAGCTLRVKHEGVNPTGSFKDRGTAVAVSHVAATGGDWIGTVSHGNMALSTAAYAASAGLECAVFVPAHTPASRLETIGQHGPHVFAVDGDYGRLYEETLALADETGVRFVNSDTPLRVAGQKTVAYEIVEALPTDPPDAIALPVSSGGHASGVWKALRELRAVGLLDSLPRIYLVQAAACDPIAAAYREDRAEVTPVTPGETIAVSIANPDPPSGTRALAAVRETGGAVCSVDDDAISEAGERLATDAGLSVEPSSATALAGVRELARRGEIAPDDSVVLVLTGSGYKYQEAGGGDDQVASVRRVTLDEIAVALEDVTGGDGGQRT